MRLAIFSAFPQELRPILKKFKTIKRVKKEPFTLFFVEYSSTKIILVQTGIRIQNGNNALKYIIEEHCPEFILSIGFGGALYEDALIGDLVWASRIFLIPEGIKVGVPYLLEVPDVRKIVSRLSGKVAMYEGCIVTLERWMKKPDIKNILPPELSHPVCDMETFYLAKLSIQKGMPFFAVRSITDQTNEEIPIEFLNVCDESGSYRFTRALRLLLRKPKLIPNVMRLRRNSVVASNSLWRVVKSLLEILTGGGVSLEHRDRF